MVNKNNGVCTTPQNSNQQTLPWNTPKIIAMTSVLGGKVVSVKNITEPTIRRANNETFYR
jgi:hypothetical protein